MAKRKIIVHIATSTDGYIARPDGNVDWLTNRPAPKGFYGSNKPGVARAVGKYLAIALILAATATIGWFSFYRDSALQLPLPDKMRAYLD